MILHVPLALLVAVAWPLGAVVAEGVIRGALLGAAVGMALGDSGVRNALGREVVGVAIAGLLLDAGAGVPLPELQLVIKSAATMAMAAAVEGP